MSLCSRKDLVLVNENNKIIDEINLYYDYSNGVFARTKLYFIDKKNNIYIKYYFEDEEGVSKFSKITKYNIQNTGMIVKK